MKQLVNESMSYLTDTMVGSFLYSSIHSSGKSVTGSRVFWGFANLFCILLLWIQYILDFELVVENKEYENVTFCQIRWILQTLVSLLKMTEDDCVCIDR